MCNCEIGPGDTSPVSRWRSAPLICCAGRWPVAFATVGSLPCRCAAAPRSERCSAVLAADRDSRKGCWTVIFITTNRDSEYCTASLGERTYAPPHLSTLSHPRSPIFLLWVQVVRCTSIERYRMRTPSGSTWAQFSQSLHEFLDHQCFLLAKRLCCSKCGSSIVHSRVALSIHDSAFHSASTAFDKGAWIMTLPYCPRCEEKPEQRGCVHVSFSDFHKTC
jgi:hypothetical protein